MIPLQVDVFSFGVVIYELLIRQVTSAVVSQSGDATMPEMYANKVNLCCKLLVLPLLHLNHKLAHQSNAASLKSQLFSFVTTTVPLRSLYSPRQADKQLCNVWQPRLMAHATKS